MREASKVSGAEQFVAHLELIERVIAFVSRRHHLRTDEADEFGSHVKFKLVEHDYAVFEKFKGESSLRTYLTVVIQRLFLDYRCASWGKWRPSAVARRLGPLAILLERLLTRDGHTLAEACEILQTNHGVSASGDELEQLAAQLPPRTTRRFESDAALIQMPSSERAPDDLAAEQDRTRAALRVSEALAQAMAALEPRDRLILTMLFDDGRTVAEIAAVLRLEQKPLYRYIKQLLKTLRENLERQGVDKAAVAEILKSQTVSLKWPGFADTENDSSGPSISQGGAEWR